MRPEKFLKSKIEYQLRMRGKSYSFSIFGEDVYHQKSSTSTGTVTILGIFHEATVYKKSTGTDSGVTTPKSSPMVMCLSEEVKGITKGSRVTINETLYEVTGLEDLNDYGVVTNISLEEVV